jgi:osmotically-inducible protein OsmY
MIALKPVFFHPPDGTVVEPECLPRAGSVVPSHSEEDRRLKNSIERALLAAGHHIFRKVTILVQNREVTLRGWVSSYYLKQLTQSVVLAVPGAVEVCNELVVSEPC